MTASKKKVWLTDTTLRDGEQSCGFALSIDRKVRIARMLDEAGFYQIEAGIPAMGSCEKDAICRIMDIRKNAKIAVWNRMSKEDIAHSFDCKPDVIHISATVSDIMIGTMLKKSRKWVLETLKSCVSYAKEKGYEVTVGFQDAARADMTFMIMLANELESLGVQTVRLADTVGILRPLQARQLVQNLLNETGMSLGIHTHNDLGMATAIAIEAVKAGAKFVDTTLFGIGERAGNCDSYKFAGSTKELFNVTPVPKKLERLTSGVADILFQNSEKEAWTM